MSKLDQGKRVLLIHISFWCVYFSFFLYRISGHQRGGAELDWGFVFSIAAIAIFFTMTIAYINYFLLLPRFLKRKRLTRYLLELAPLFAFVIFLRVQVERLLISYYNYPSDYANSSRFIIQISLITLFIVIFVAMLRFAEDWFFLEAKRKEIENEKLTAELNFLKAQINPHFLFNTLNNLYYLAFTKSENTTEVIAKLSQMMRYMIYDSNHPKVLLSKEIEYMQNYISLERLRLNNELKICFEVMGDPGNVKVVPLIFITFLENAFKHGVSSNNPEAWVKVKIDLNGKGCVYTVQNSKVNSKKSDIEEKSGIGLQNVSRRLELSYPGDYDLKVDDQNGQYSVQLKLNLN
jgi:two-component system, LytTR family, sensor histidine kinase AlgZ